MAKITRNPPSRPQNTVPVNKVQDPITLDRNPSPGFFTLIDAITKGRSQPLSHVVENATVVECVSPTNGGEKSKYSIDHLNLDNRVFEDYLLRIYDPENDICLINPRDEFIKETGGTLTSPSQIIKNTPNDPKVIAAKRKYYHQTITQTKVFAPRRASGLLSSPPKIGEKVRIYYFQNPTISSGETIAGFYEKMTEGDIYEKEFEDLLSFFASLRQKFIDALNKLFPVSNANIPPAVVPSSAQAAAVAQQQLAALPPVTTVTQPANPTEQQFAEAVVPILDIIASGESGTDRSESYNMMNQGTSDDAKIINPGNSRKVINKVLTEMTFAQIKEAQALKQGPDRIFAAGRYQFIPGTLKGTQSNTSIKDTDLFNAQNQDILASALIRTAALKQHGRILYNYLIGASNDRVNALSCLANQWRSFMDPYTGGTFGQVKNDANKASIPISRYAPIVDQVRAKLTSTTPSSTPTP